MRRRDTLLICNSEKAGFQFVSEQILEQRVAEGKQPQILTEQKNAAELKLTYIIIIPKSNAGLREASHFAILIDPFRPQSFITQQRNTKEKIFALPRIWRRRNSKEKLTTCSILDERGGGKRRHGSSSSRFRQVRMSL